MYNWTIVPLFDKHIESISWFVCSVNLYNSIFGQFPASFSLDIGVSCQPPAANLGPKTGFIGDKKRIFKLNIVFWVVWWIGVLILPECLMMTSVD